MPGDILSGRYPLTAAFWSGVGQPANATQSNIPVRSNLEWPFLGDLADQAAALVSGSVTVVPVPVDIGNVITKVSILTGATANADPTNQWAAVYSGVLTTAVLQGAQSTDATSTAIPVSGRWGFTLGASVEVTAANAPYGYVYVGIGIVVSTTLPSLICAACATAAQYKWYADTPYFANSYGSGLTSTAPSSLTLAGTNKQAAVPAVFLY
jgi:hypothetical protein